MATSASASLPKSIAVLGAGHVGAPHAIMLAKKCPDMLARGIFKSAVMKIAIKAGLIN
jgi:UDP-N-acetyl-D-mannosaminuronate dehydrogenase